MAKVSRNHCLECFLMSILHLSGFFYHWWNFYDWISYDSTADSNWLTLLMTVQHKYMFLHKCKAFLNYSLNGKCNTFYRFKKKRVEKTVGNYSSDW